MLSNCISCGFWEPAQSSRRGVCRRYAPRVSLLLIGAIEPELKAVWPSTEASDQCGEWRSPKGVADVLRSRRVISRCLEKSQGGENDFPGN
jgi:hypothetical protein